MVKETDVDPGFSRRSVLAGGATGALVVSGPLPVGAVPSSQSDETVLINLSINGVNQSLSVDPRMTLLDLVRDRLEMTGAKKGCDHGQCGACTMLVEGRRIYSCLTLAVLHEGESVTTIEGLGRPGALHPMQSAFVEHDGFQCGFCTPGQICSAVGMLDELRQGVPSHVTDNLEQVVFTDEELRERMSGNICRCAAYPNIVAAIRSVGEGRRS